MGGMGGFGGGFSGMGNNAFSLNKPKARGAIRPQGMQQHTTPMPPPTAKPYTPQPVPPQSWQQPQMQPWQQNPTAPSPSYPQTNMPYANPFGGGYGKGGMGSPYGKGGMEGGMFGGMGGNPYGGMPQQFDQSFGVTNQAPNGQSWGDFYGPKNIQNLQGMVGNMFGGMNQPQVQKPMGGGNAWEQPGFNPNMSAVGMPSQQFQKSAMPDPRKLQAMY